MDFSCLSFFAVFIAHRSHVYPEFSAAEISGTTTKHGSMGGRVNKTGFAK